MITICWSAKGGSGTTVVAAAMALSAVEPTLLVDLAGDLPATLGIPTPDGPGLDDWLASEAAPGRLNGLEVRVRDQLLLLPKGRATGAGAGRWAELAGWLAADHRRVVVDAGSNGPPPPALRRAATQSLLVTRPCYLALCAAQRTDVRPTGVVLVDEPGRALRAADIEAGLGVPVIATVLLDPAVARAVDSGLLLARLPGGFRRALHVAA